MPSGAVPDVAEQPDGEGEKAVKLRRFSYGVSAALILLCNAVFLAGLWGSGVNLDALVRTPDVFDPAKDVCLRLTWHQVTGGTEPVKLCNEWINLSDPSGDVHTFKPDTKVVQGGDGKLYFDHGAMVDYRFFLLTGFVAAVILAGVMLKRYLIARYRIRLNMQGPGVSSS